MGVGFMRIHDMWQVFEGKKCKKKSISAKKCKKPSFIVPVGIAPKSINAHLRFSSSFRLWPG
jgi:hypothetical protein